MRTVFFPDAREAGVGATYGNEKCPRLKGRMTKEGYPAVRTNIFLVKKIKTHQAKELRCVLAPLKRFAYWSTRSVFEPELARK